MLIILGGVAVVLLAASIVLYLLCSVINDSTVDRFAKVKDGMTLREVIKIMGRDPTFDQQEPDGNLMYGWSYQETTQAVTVYTRDGLTISKKPLENIGSPVLPDVATPWKHIVRNK